MLTIQNEEFCQLYTTKGDTFGNAYKSYAEAYGFEIPIDPETGKTDYKSSEYKVCQNGGSRLLFKAEIKNRLKEILLERFNDNTVADARLQEIIEAGDDRDSIQAIKHYNELKNRITQKVNISVDRPLANLTDEELKKMIN